MKNKQIIIFFVGADKSGKTTIATKLSSIINIPYFKNIQEKTPNFNFYDALHYQGEFAYQFLSQTRYSLIRDREYPCEYAYSKVFNRKTDYDFIMKLDRLYVKCNLHIIFCFKDNYTDEDMSKETITINDIYNINNEYLQFLKLTHNPHLVLNTTDRNLNTQLKTIIDFLNK